MTWTWYADIGNCTLHWAARAAAAWQIFDRIGTKHLDDGDWEEIVVRQLTEAGLRTADCGQAVVCVSAPQRLRKLQEFATQALKTNVEILGTDFPANMSTDYYDPTQIGADRLVNALAAVASVGKPCVVLDFGSCLTCDAVSAEGILVGGAIAPGLPILRRGLVSVVPHLQPDLQESWASLGNVSDQPGRSTAEGLALGIRHSLAASADRLASIMRRHLQTDAPVVATGGDAALIVPRCELEMQIDEQLTLEGLRLAFEVSLTNPATSAD